MKNKSSPNKKRESGDAGAAMRPAEDKTLYGLTASKSSEVDLRPESERPLSQATIEIEVSAINGGAGKPDNREAQEPVVSHEEEVLPSLLADDSSTLACEPESMPEIFSITPTSPKEQEDIAEENADRNEEESVASQMGYERSSEIYTPVTVTPFSDTEPESDKRPEAENVVGADSTIDPVKVVRSTESDAAHAQTLPVVVTGDGQSSGQVEAAEGQLPLESSASDAHQEAATPVNSTTKVDPVPLIGTSPTDPLQGEGNTGAGAPVLQDSREAQVDHINGEKDLNWWDCMKSTIPEFSPCDTFVVVSVALIAFGLAPYYGDAWWDTTSML